MKGTARAAGHDLYANEGTNVPARGQAIVGTEIAIGLPHNTYGRIAPRSSLAVKHRLTTNAGVIDSEYRGEVKVVLANLGDQPYRVEKTGPDCTPDHRTNRQQRTTRSNSVGRYRERGSRIQELQQHHEPKGRGPGGQTKNGNQPDIGKSLRTVLPKRRNDGHPKMGRSRPRNPARSYQYQHRTGDKEQKEQQGPRRQGHGPTRISSPVRCIRKRRKNDSTTTPTRD